MNRAPFDQLVLSGMRDPSKSLALFGSSEKLDRIKKLESTVGLMAHELQVYNARLDEIGANQMEDLLDIRKLKMEMVSKQDLKKEQTARFASVFDLDKALNKHRTAIDNLHRSNNAILDKTQALSTASLHLMSQVEWLNEAVRALHAQQPLPPTPHEVKQSFPTRKQSATDRVVMFNPPPDEEE